MKNLMELRGDWMETKDKLKKKFAQLTASDLLFIDGKEEEMLVRIQNKLGKSKNEIKQIIAEL